MLYTNSSVDFPKLTEVMRKLSVPEETVAVMKDYLDISKPRRNELLEGVEAVGPGFDLNWQLREEIDKAVSKDIVK